MTNRVTVKWLQESRLPYMVDVAKEAGVDMTGWSIGRHFGPMITLVDDDMNRYGTWATASDAERGTDAMIMAWQAVTAATRDQNVITVTGYRRLASSSIGHPRFALNTTRGEVLTSSNASCNYGIENGWTVYNPIATTKKRRQARVKLTRAGRIAELEWLDGNN